MRVGSLDPLGTLATEEADMDANRRSAVAERVVEELYATQLEVIEGQTFVDSDVWLDGRGFVRCTFRRCRLIVEVGRFGFEDCEFPDTAMEARDPFKQALQAMSVLVTDGTVGYVRGDRRMN